MRCFVALQPDASTAAGLIRLQDAWRMRAPRSSAVRAENLHLTLAFIGELPPDAVPRVVDALAALPHRDVDWTVTTVGGFAGARVLWAGGPASPSLRQCAQTVREALDARGLRYDDKPFVPHITLLRRWPRRLPEDASLAEPLRWRGSAPQLMRSTSTAEGVRYDVLPAS